MSTLQVVTYNIHKGFSQFKRHVSVYELRERLRGLAADIVFLQEVQGSHSRHQQRHRNWPEAPQYEFLADVLWRDFAYGRNAVYDSGHHGNAILSKFPIVCWHNEDISMSRLENRGLLHCEIEVPGWRARLHCVNVHLGLFARWRKKQLEVLRHRIEHLVPREEPLVVAGDFNDWRRKASHQLAVSLGMTEVFEHAHGRPARSFPAALPLLHLDRIYVRGFRVRLAHAHRDRHWSRISDHVALSALLERA
ncbi:MAG TPA: endonuclease/exonuclease/phosphatase family protein [Burkholderiales bacterium]|nr:endonuclease/exonuclease/phosphatase family protein [Burkholderiales bacterium]